MAVQTIQVKRKSDECEVPPEETEKTNGHKEGQFEEQVVAGDGDVVDEPVEIPKFDDIQKYVDMMVELGEGGLRDALYKDGKEIDVVENIITDVHRAMKRGVRPSKEGMYASGGAENLIDNVDGLFNLDDEEAVGKEPKKKEKKSEYDDPVDEIVSILKEGRPVPLKLARRLLGTVDNFERLKTVPGVVVTQYQIYIKID